MLPTLRFLKNGESSFLAALKRYEAPEGVILATPLGKLAQGRKMASRRINASALRVDMPSN